MDIFEKALQYVRDNKTWTKEQESRSLHEMDVMRCPLWMTHDGQMIEYAIHDLMEEFGDDNELGDEWWTEFVDSCEEIFWKL